jgi:hypothetical protein
MKLEHTLKQLTALGYVDGSKVHLRAFYPEKGKDAGRSADFIYPEVPVELIQRWQNEGRGVYFVVNQGGHTDDSIDSCLAVFYEHDDLDKESQLQLWQDLGLPQPTVQVDTGGKSIHSYWVFTEPTSVEQWRKLQVDLLEFADADRKLKNPSRVMRLAGCLHAQTGQYTRIVGGNGERHEFNKVRSIVPAAQIESRVTQKGITWSEFNQQWSFPVSDSVPLEACLSRKNRDLLANGAQDGSRNDCGFKLAADLLAVTAFLTQEGQRFNGDPYQLFLSYCQRCASGDGWNQREWDALWKSAQRSPRNSSLSPEQIEGCVKGWAWNNCPDRTMPDVSQIGRALPEPKTVKLDNAPSDASDEERLRIDIANYNKVLYSGNRFQCIPLRRKIAKEWGLTVSEIDELSRELQRGSAGDLSPVSSSLVFIQKEIQNRSGDREDVGVPSGYYDLDAMTQGFQRGDLIVIAGRPSMGKTAAVLGIARNVAFLKKKTVANLVELVRTNGSL